MVGHTSGIFLTTLFPRAEGVGRAEHCQGADDVNNVAEKGPVRVADGREWLRRDIIKVRKQCRLFK